MFAIINKNNGKFLSGTDYRCSPPKQILSRHMTLLFEYGFQAQTELNGRCRWMKDKSNYKIVKVEINIIRDATIEDLND